MDHIQDKPGSTYIQIIFSVLFFMWGLLTVLNFILIDHLAYLFTLSYSLSTLINLTFFLTYFIVALRANTLIRQVGYKKGIIWGWVLATMGCLMFYVSVKFKIYNLLFVALILQGAGFTILQVGANLYVVLYGRAQTSASRLNFVQGFNSLGTLVAPVLLIIIQQISGFDGHVKDFLVKVEYFPIIHNLILGLSIAMIVFGIFLSQFKIPHINIEHQDPWNLMPYHPRRHVMHFPQLRLGAFAIFAYVGAEVALNNYLVDFAEENVKFYWGAAMVGRFIGALVLTKISPRVAVGISGSMSIILVLTSILSSATGVGTVSIWAITLVGFFNSILFPTIFALGVNGLGKFSLNGSAVLVMSIAGGAVIPFMVRNFSLMKGFPRELSLQLAFIIPVICYTYIVLYGLIFSRFEKREAVQNESHTYIV